MNNNNNNNNQQQVQQQPQQLTPEQLLAQLQLRVIQLEGQLQLVQQAPQPQQVQAPQVPQALPHEPKLPPPMKFNSDRSQFRSFLAQCDNIFHMQPRIYWNHTNNVHNSPTCVGLVASAFEGLPAAWYVSLVANNSPLLNSYTLFSAKFTALYDDSERECTAIRMLEGLKQQNSTVFEYASTFC